MKIRTLAQLAAAVATLALASVPAHAQLFRAYVSPTGSDSNACTLPAPCRLLPAALAAVADGGEIWMLDSANYNTGPVYVTKSVTILAVPGAIGSVVASGGDAIDMATAGVSLTLRNLVIVPLPGAGGQNGINMTAGGTLVVEGCLIANLPAAGISVSPSSNAKVRIVDSTIRGNGSGVAANGIWVWAATASTSTTVDISNTNVDGNYQGIMIGSGNASAAIKASIRETRVRQSADNAIFVQGNGAVTVAISQSQVSDNALNGITAYGSAAKVWVSGNSVTNNATGMRVSSGGVIETAGNNDVRNNSGGDIYGGSLTPVSLN